MLYTSRWCDSVESYVTECNVYSLLRSNNMKKISNNCTFNAEHTTGDSMKSNKYQLVRLIEVTFVSLIL